MADKITHEAITETVRHKTTQFGTAVTREKQDKARQGTSTCMRTVRKMGEGKVKLS